VQALEISVHCKCFPYIFIIYVFDIFSVLFLEMKDTYQLDMQDADQFLNLLHTLSDDLVYKFQASYCIQKFSMIFEIYIG
jgi:hypothetical protein